MSKALKQSINPSVSQKSLQNSGDPLLSTLPATQSKRVSNLYSIKRISQQPGGPPCLSKQNKTKKNIEKAAKGLVQDAVATSLSKFSSRERSPLPLSERGQLTQRSSLDPRGKPSPTSLPLQMTLTIPGRDSISGHNQRTNRRDNSNEQIQKQNVKKVSSQTKRLGQAKGKASQQRSSNQGGQNQVLVLPESVVAYKGKQLHSERQSPSTYGARGGDKRFISGLSRDGSPVSSSSYNRDLLEQTYNKLMKQSTYVQKSNFPDSKVKEAMAKQLGVASKPTGHSLGPQAKRCSGSPPTNRRPQSRKPLKNPSSNVAAGGISRYPTGCNTNPHSSKTRGTQDTAGATFLSVAMVKVNLPFSNNKLPSQQQEPLPQSLQLTMQVPPPPSSQAWCKRSPQPSSFTCKHSKSSADKSQQFNFSETSNGQLSLIREQVPTSSAHSAAPRNPAGFGSSKGKVFLPSSKEKLASATAAAFQSLLPPPRQHFIPVSKSTAFSPSPQSTNRQTQKQLSKLKESSMSKATASSLLGRASHPGAATLNGGSPGSNSSEHKSLLLSRSVGRSSRHRSPSEASKRALQLLSSGCGDSTGIQQQQQFSRPSQNQLLNHYHHHTVAYSKKSTNSATVSNSTIMVPIKLTKVKGSKKLQSQSLLDQMQQQYQLQNQQQQQLEQQNMVNFMQSFRKGCGAAMHKLNLQLSKNVAKQQFLTTQPYSTAAINSSMSTALQQDGSLSSVKQPSNSGRVVLGECLQPFTGSSCNGKLLASGNSQQRRVADIGKKQQQLQSGENKENLNLQSAYWTVTVPSSSSPSGGVGHPALSGSGQGARHNVKPVPPLADIKSINLAGNIKPEQLLQHLSASQPSSVRHSQQFTSLLKDDSLGKPTAPGKGLVAAGTQKMTLELRKMKTDKRNHQELLLKNNHAQKPGRQAPNLLDIDPEGDNQLVVPQSQEHQAASLPFSTSQPPSFTHATQIQSQKNVYVKEQALGCSKSLKASIIAMHAQPNKSSQQFYEQQHQQRTVERQRQDTVLRTPVQVGAAGTLTQFFINDQTTPRRQSMPVTQEVASIQETSEFGCPSSGGSPSPQAPLHSIIDLQSLDLQQTPKRHSAPAGGSPGDRQEYSCPLNEEDTPEQKLNNTAIDDADLRRQVEAKLHYLQFQKVYCASRGQMQRQGEATGPSHHVNTMRGSDYSAEEGYYSASSSQEGYSQDAAAAEEEHEGAHNFSGITNFSMEIEMLNKMHIQKNNRDRISQLPVICDQLVPDPDLSLYFEQATEEGRLLFVKDTRHKICFRDPYAQQQQSRLPTSKTTSGTNTTTAAGAAGAHLQLFQMQQRKANVLHYDQAFFELNGRRNIFYNSFSSSSKGKESYPPAKGLEKNCQDLALEQSLESSSLSADDPRILRMEASEQQQQQSHSSFNVFEYQHNDKQTAIRCLPKQPASEYPDFDPQKTSSLGIVGTDRETALLLMQNFARNINQPSSSVSRSSQDDDDGGASQRVTSGREQDFDGIPEIVNLSDSQMLLSNMNSQQSLRQTLPDRSRQPLEMQQTLVNQLNQVQQLQLQYANSISQQQQYLLYSNSYSPSSCSSSQYQPHMKSSRCCFNEEGYRQELIEVLGKQEFEELESINEDSSVYFGNAPCKKHRPSEDDGALFSRGEGSIPLASSQSSSEAAALGVEDYETPCHQNQTLQRKLFDQRSSSIMTVDSVQTQLITNHSHLREKANIGSNEGMMLIPPFTLYDLTEASLGEGQSLFIKPAKYGRMRFYQEGGSQEEQNLVRLEYFNFDALQGSRENRSSYQSSAEKPTSKRVRSAAPSSSSSSSQAKPHCALSLIDDNNSSFVRQC